VALGMITSQIDRMQLIRENSAIHEFDYVEAIISVESSWRPDVVSNKGAHGLMQVTNWAIRDVRATHSLAEAHGYMAFPDPPDPEWQWYLKYCTLYRGDSDEDILRKSLTDPALNVKIGTCYLWILLRRYKNDWTKVLIAYNGGPRQVKKYLRGEEMAPETANYVLKVEQRRKAARE